MPARRYHIIFNPKAGTALAMGITTPILSEHFTKAGLDFTLDDDDELELSGRIQKALAGDADVIVAADVGSTCLAVAEALVARDDLDELVVVTNGLGIALALERAIPRFTVVVTGGTLRPLQHSLVDPIASRTLAELHVDFAIIGCNGVADDGTITNVNLPEAEVKAAMLAATGSAILVADGSKAGQRHLGRIGSLTDFATLVTDASGSERLTRAAAGTGCAVVAA